MSEPAKRGELVRGNDTIAIERVSEPISDPVIYARKLEELAQVANVIAMPPQMIGGFVPGFQIAASVVRINTTVNDDGQGPETYRDKGFMKGDSRALNKMGLLKIASALNLKWAPETRRTDDGSQRYLWSYFAKAIIDTPDGGYRELTGEYEVDLRDGSPQIGGWTPEAWQQLVLANKGLRKDDQTWHINGWSERRVMQARTVGLRLAESKAKNRAIREVGLQQVYTVQELAKPFIVFRAIYVPDTSDPVIKQMVAERALHGRRLLYPGDRGPVTQGALPPVPPAGTITVAASDPEEPDEAGVGLTIISVEQVRHEGEPLDLWDVRTSDGKTARTNSRETAEAARRLCASAQLVELVTEPSERRAGGLNITELRPAPTKAAKPSAADLY